MHARLSVSCLLLVACSGGSTSDETDAGTCTDDCVPFVDAGLCALDCGAHGSCEAGRCECELGWSGTSCDACAGGFVDEGGSCVAPNNLLRVDIASGRDDCSYAQVVAGECRWASVLRAVWGTTDRAGAGNAAEAAKPGDIVVVAPGVYSSSRAGIDDDRWIMSLPIINGPSATEALPIVIKAQFPASLNDDRLSILQHTGGRGPIIGGGAFLWDDSYITWDGFYIDEADAIGSSDTGPVAIGGASHVRIVNMHMRGLDAGHPQNYWNNHNLIRVEFSNDIIIANNRLTNLNRDEGGSDNSAAIMGYSGIRVLVENNEIYASEGGVWPKGGDPGNSAWTIRKNYLHGLYGLVGIKTTVLNNLAGPSEISQNLIVGGGNIRLDPFVGVSPVEVLVANNTIFDPGPAVLGFYYRDTDLFQSTRVFNNIVYRLRAGGPEDEHGAHATESDFVTFQAFDIEIDHNVYGDLTVLWSHSSGYDPVDFQGWQAAGYDASGLLAEPGFVTVGSDFRLMPAAAARAQGQDILDLAGGGQDATIPAGCYITDDQSDVIGIDPDYRY